MEQALNEKLNMPELKKNHDMAVWFVGDVQGEERDIVYYSLVEDSKYGNADLGGIYPVTGGTADNPQKIKDAATQCGIQSRQGHNGLCSQHAD
jgi:hypothetical protein